MTNRFNRLLGRRVAQAFSAPEPDWKTLAGEAVVRAEAFARRCEELTIEVQSLRPCEAEVATLTDALDRAEKRIRELEAEASGRTMGP